MNDLAESVSGKPPVSKTETAGSIPASAAISLQLVPITWRAANAFVKALHRHSAPTQGCTFCVSVRDDTGALRGVGIAGRPVARQLQDGFTFEVTRLCTDGAPNACSMLYGALTRAAKALGYRRGVTYVLATEPGTSLRASGWRRAAQVRAEAWGRPGRARSSAHQVAPRVRWEWP